MTVKELYQWYPSLLVFHSIAETAPETKVPDDVDFAGQVAFTLDPETTKVSSFTFAFGQESDRHYLGDMGVIIKDGTIVASYIEDSGLTKDDIIHRLHLNPSDDLKDVVDSSRRSHNEIILKEVSAAGIWVKRASPDKIPVIQRASLANNLDVYLLNEHGLCLLKFNDNSKQFEIANTAHISRIGEF